MIFKKTCFSCGTKVDQVKEGLCEVCYRKENPPLKEIKPLNLKLCNMCGKIHYMNSLYTLDKIEIMLPSILEKNISLNKGYILKSVEIENFYLEGHNLEFEIILDTEFDSYN